MGLDQHFSFETELSAGMGPETGQPVTASVVESTLKSGYGQA